MAAIAFARPKNTPALQARVGAGENAYMNDKISSTPSQARSARKKTGLEILMTSFMIFGLRHEIWHLSEHSLQKSVAISSLSEPRGGYSHI